ncbi:MAG: hypothetical protein K9N35_03375 [Candidatus Marinimicrobia bacterium]|nr:hypothetical protein [Candidatus Neomarinimicrobiota bacterium]
MKRVFIAVFMLTILINLGLAQTLKPYVLGAVSSENMQVTKEKTRSNLDSSDFNILGEYAPAKDNHRWVFVVNSAELIQAVQSTGGLTGFAAALRIALTEEDGKVLISYTNPYYLGNAYFQKSFPDVESLFATVDRQLTDIMSGLGEARFTAFGVEEGIEAKDLRHYHYMFGMEYFEDVVELNDFSTFEAGKTKIEAALAKGGNTELVYACEVPGKELKLYGIALSGDTGEEHFLPIIDISTPKHTAFLPYEILLMGDTAIMLHGRYRIALSFPDLTMTTFGKIMSTPGDIEDLMQGVTE